MNGIVSVGPEKVNGLFSRDLRKLSQDITDKIQNFQNSPMYCKYSGVLERTQMVVNKIMTYLFDGHRFTPVELDNYQNCLDEINRCLRLNLFDELERKLPSSNHEMWKAAASVFLPWFLCRSSSPAIANTSESLGTAFNSQKIEASTDQTSMKIVQDIIDDRNDLQKKVGKSDTPMDGGDGNNDINSQLSSASDNYSNYLNQCGIDILKSTIIPISVDNGGTHQVYGYRVDNGGFVLDLKGYNLSDPITIDCSSLTDDNDWVINGGLAVANWKGNLDNLTVTIKGNTYHIPDIRYFLYKGSLKDSISLIPGDYTLPCNADLSFCNKNGTFKKVLKPSHIKDGFQYHQYDFGTFTIHPDENSYINLATFNENTPKGPLKECPDVYGAYCEEIEGFNDKPFPNFKDNKFDEAEKYRWLYERVSWNSDKYWCSLQFKPKNSGNWTYVYDQSYDPDNETACFIGPSEPIPLPLVQQEDLSNPPDSLEKARTLLNQLKTLSLDSLPSFRCYPSLEALHADNTPVGRHQKWVDDFPAWWEKTFTYLKNQTKDPKAQQEAIELNNEINNENDGYLSRWTQFKQKIDEAWTIQDKSDKFTTSPHPDFSQYRTNDWDLVDTYFKSHEDDEFGKHIDFDHYRIFNDSCNAFIDGTPANKALQGVDALSKEASDLQNPNFMSMSLSDLSSLCGPIGSLCMSITNKLPIMGDTLNAYKVFLENPNLLDGERNALSYYFNKLHDSLKLEDTKNALSTYRDNINDRLKTLSTMDHKIMDLQLGNSFLGLAVDDIQSDFAKCGVSVEQLSSEAQAKYQAALDILNNPETPFYNITEDMTLCNNLLNQYSNLSTSSDGKTVEELQNMITSNTKLCSDMESALSILTTILNEKKLNSEDRTILENLKSRLSDAIQGLTNVNGTLTTALNTLIQSQQEALQQEKITKWEKGLQTLSDNWNIDPQYLSGQITQLENLYNNRPNGGNTSSEDMFNQFFRSYVNQIWENLYLSPVTTNWNWVEHCAGGLSQSDYEIAKTDYETAKTDYETVFKLANDFVTTFSKTFNTTDFKDVLEKYAYVSPFRGSSNFQTGIFDALSEQSQSPKVWYDHMSGTHNLYFDIELNGCNYGIVDIEGKQICSGTFHGNSINLGNHLGKVLIINFVDKSGQSHRVKIPAF